MDHNKFKGPRGTEDEVHKELLNCHPVYQQASTTTPRWKRILGFRRLAAFGRHHQDHPVPQCKNCWSLRASITNKTSASAKHPVDTANLNTQGPRAIHAPQRASTMHSTTSNAATAAELVQLQMSSTQPMHSRLFPPNFLAIASTYRGRILDRISITCNDTGFRWTIFFSPLKCHLKVVRRD
jgi:hypothetical protein